MTTLLSPADADALIDIVTAAATAEILPRFRNLTAAQIDTKSGPLDLVTEADTAAEAAMAAALRRRWPAALVVGEEAVAADPSLRDAIHEAELAFIIDPVDGTWNFAHGLPLFGVILAATRFGTPVFGLLHDPVTGSTMYATEADTARERHADGRDLPLAIAPPRALAEQSGYVHLSLLPKPQQRALAPVLPRLGRTLVLRCSCHEYRTMAQGAMDFTLSGTLNPWDHAAGLHICTRAGGTVRMLDGSEYNTRHRSGFVLAASHAEGWAALADLFNSALATA